MSKINERIYTQFQLRLVNHVAHKATQTGDHSSAFTMWRGTISFETAEVIHSEIEVERDIETLIHFDALETFGKSPLLTGIQFHWETRLIEINSEKEPVEYCMVSVNYMSRINRVNREEMLLRLKRMGFENINGMNLEAVTGLEDDETLRP